MKLLYTFLIKRPQDKEAWPTVYTDHELAERCPYRASDVYQTTAIERVPVNIPEPKPKPEAMLALHSKSRGSQA